MICAKLKFISPYKETFWYVRSWDEWPSKPGFRYIRSTTAKEERATCFASAEEAAKILVLADNPAGWEIAVTEVDAMPTPVVPVDLSIKKLKPINPGNK